MIFFFIIVSAFILILLSRFLFRKWFNHLSLYTIIWSVMLCLYEIRFLNYIPLTSDAWILIIAAFVSYLLGILTIFAARSTFGKQNDINLLVKPDPEKYLIFSNNGKYLEYAIWILGIIGLAGAIQHWMVLIKMFGSIPKVLLHANLIYRMRIENEIPGVVPYLFIGSYSAVFLAGLYTAYKSRFSIVAIIPILGVILKDIANVGRAGILMGFFEFAISLILARYMFSKSTQKRKQNNRKNIIVAAVVVTALMVGSATLVRSVRGTIETFQSADRQLRKMQSGLFITPSIYLYASSHIGVFSKYLDANNEHLMFGENTFMPIYSFISKTGLIPQPQVYSKGYLIPMWTNTGTYLRDIHEDFGLQGLFIVPYLIGLITTFYWFKCYEKSRIIDFAILVYLYLMVSLSFMLIVSRFSIWFLSIFLLAFTIPAIEKIAEMLKNIHTNDQ